MVTANIFSILNPESEKHVFRCMNEKEVFVKPKKTIWPKFVWMSKILVQQRMDTKYKWAKIQQDGHVRHWMLQS